MSVSLPFYLFILFIFYIMGFLNTLSGIANGATQGLGLVQGAYNLYKDMNNVDVNRQLNAAMSLQNSQQMFNRDMWLRQVEQQNKLLENEQNFSKYMFSQQKEFSEHQSEQQFRRNLQTMDKQFALNAILSSPSRQIAGQRQAGLNPSNIGASAPAVAAPSTSQGQSPTASVPSAPSAPGSMPASAGGVGGSSSYSPLQGDINKAIETYNDTLRAKGEYMKNVASSKNTDFLTRQGNELLDGSLKEQKANIDKLKAERDSLIRNYQLREMELNENVRMNLWRQTLEENKLKLEGMSVESQIKLNNALAYNYIQQGKLTEQQREYYVVELASKLEVNSAMAEQAKAIANKENKTLDEVLKTMKMERANMVVNTVINGLGTIFDIVKPL